MLLGHVAEATAANPSAKGEAKPAARGTRRCVRHKRQAPGFAFAVSATTVAGAPAEATPKSTSAVLRNPQVQITRQAAASASHRTDQVENVVLLACIDQLPK